MNENSLRMWIEQGNVVVSQLFFHHYSALHITDQEAMLLLQVHAFGEAGTTFPTHFELGERLGITTQDVGALIQSLMKRGLLHIETKTDADGVFHEMYSLQPLWEKVIHEAGRASMETSNMTRAEREGQLYQMFEQEFGRLLSPMESEMIAMWIDDDDHSLEVIQAALREAVLAQKMSLKYIDRILFDWKQKNVKTMKDVERVARSFQTAKRQEVEVKPSPSVPLYDWLND